ncbi:terminase large subunit [Streptococcus parauberis]|uniref:terminase large subunit n=1 Tax=Streptococcus parauberis TaxID=1348 RepID=UPI000789AE81|nr:terminase TerL endonuclease subunit [Streptococcus parauberis]QBX18162.1 terminase large subunit [Streptococcus phage Javan399]KYP20790.1 Phage Terminase [Streptococcus parauberis]KYP21174.1 Phage Terminase [Streptococcus parauberis]KYP22430.1 Phage Terminase [Streptococcus parauberis]KYP24833.1 Phage Terminase [Streptococcus parauberis]
MEKIDLTQKKNVLEWYHKIDWSEIRSAYQDAGTNYCFDVLDGKVKTGYMIKLACFRHLRDLQRQGQADFPYTYSKKEVDGLLKFAKICPNVDTGEPTKLMAWQEFILAMLFGWRNLNGGKRYGRAMVSVARGQGKTYLMAILTAYSYFIESLGLSNQDYLVASINFKQTNKLLGYIKSMMKQISLKEPFKSLAIEVDLGIHSDQVIMKSNNNVLRAISAESGQYDSFHFTTAIFDEIGELKTREATSKIVSGQVKVPNKQFIQISTAYPDPNVPFHEDQKMLQQAMEEDYKRDADTYLCLVWQQDSLDEVFKEEEWVKSNPLLDLESERDVLLKGLKDKREEDLMSGEIADFQVKNMNCWLLADSNSFLDLEDIEKAIVPEFDIKRKRVYVGVDYSLFSDNTAVGFVYPYETEKKWHVEQHSFIPWKVAGSIEAKEKQDGINYRDLEKQGFCTITSHPQGLINDDEVYQWIVNFVEDNELDVIWFGYDAMGISKVIKALELNTSYPLMPIRQRTSELKDPTKFLQTLFIEANITRLNDKIMEKALLNAVIKEDNIGIQVDKMKSTLKVDVVDAIIDGMYQAMYHYDDYGLANDKSYMVEHMSAQAVKDWLNNPESGMLDEEFY